MKKIYLTIDSLYDTRLVILSSLGIVNKDNIEYYINRVNDNFKYIGNKPFRLLYNDRNRNYLLRAKRTKIAYLIGIIATELKSKDDSGIELFVNINPYKFLNSEIINLKNGLKSIFSTVDYITIIDEEVTKDIVDQYDVIIDYDGLNRLNDWILEGLQATPRDTRLIAPYELIEPEILLRDKVDIEEAVEKMNKLMYPFVYLDLVPPFMFSIDLEKEKTDRDSE